MSRGSVYDLPRPTSAADLELLRRIDALHLAQPGVGARMLRRPLHRQGVDVGRRQIAALMQRMGLEALPPQPGTSMRAPGHRTDPSLLRKLAIALEACPAREVIAQAFARWGTPEIVNADQGRQFTATESTDVVLGQSCQPMMDGRGARRHRRPHALVQRRAGPLAPGRSHARRALLRPPVSTGPGRTR